MYDAAFYDMIRPGVQSSAAVVAPLVHRLISPASVVDVGCGEGWWAAAFADLGCQVLGVDGAYVQQRAVVPFRAHDLAFPLPDLGRCDLAVCLEVAEHLPAARAGGLVKDLTALSDVVLFSAAVPGQGGAGHVNEQPPAYWVDLFGQQGYAPSGALRWLVWDDARVENWYRANLLVFARYPQRFPDLFETPLAPPWHVIHPVLFDARRSA